jgi:hypothetical protein
MNRFLKISVLPGRNLSSLSWRLNTSLFNLLAGALLLAAGANAQVPGESAPSDSPEENPYLMSDAPAYPWPASPRPLLSASQGFEMLEMQSLPRLNLKGALNFQLGDLYNFRPSGSVLPRYSIFFRHTLQPEALIGFSIFSRGEFLPELSPESLMGYAKALYLNPLSDQTKLEMLRGPEVPLPRKAFAFMGMKPLSMTYALKDSTHELDVVRTEYFLEIANFHLVVTVEAPPALFDGIFVLARQVLAEGALLD